MVGGSLDLGDARERSSSGRFPAAERSPGRLVGGGRAPVTSHRLRIETTTTPCSASVMPGWVRNPSRFRSAVAFRPQRPDFLFALRDRQQRAGERRFQEGIGLLRSRPQHAERCSRRLRKTDAGIETATSRSTVTLTTPQPGHHPRRSPETKGNPAGRSALRKRKAMPWPGVGGPSNQQRPADQGGTVMPVIVKHRQQGMRQGVAAAPPAFH